MPSNCFMLRLSERRIQPSNNLNARPPPVLWECATLCINGTTAVVTI
jgi:hypothetical protein